MSVVKTPGGAINPPANQLVHNTALGSPESGGWNGAQSYKIMSPYGWYAPDKQKKLFKSVPRMSSLAWMRALGQVETRTSHDMIYSYYEEDELFPFSVPLGAAGPGNILTASGALAVLSYTIPAGGDAVRHHIYPTALVSDKAGEVRIVLSVVDTAGVLAITLNAAFTTPSAAGENLIFFANAQTEDSVGVESFSPTVREHKNVIQTFRAAARVTDHETAMQTFFEIDGQPHLFVKSVIDLAERFEMQHELAFLIGDWVGSPNPATKTNPATMPYDHLGGDGSRITSTVQNPAGATGYDVFTTRGLIPTITNEGTKITAVKADLADAGKVVDFFTALTDVIDDNYGPSDYMLGISRPVDMLINKFQTLFASAAAGGGNVDFSPVGGKEQAISLNLQWMNLASYQFWFNRWSILSHKATLGAAGLPYKQMMVGVPLGKTKNPKVASGEKNFMNYCSMVHLPVQAPAQIKQGNTLIWETGALASNGPTNDRLRREIHHVDYAGFEVRNKNKFFLAQITDL